MIHISVVIPTFKRTYLLERCLDALSKQELAGEYFEVIVVSDGDDEDTRMTVSNFTAIRHLTYMNLPEKKGPAAARNKGWRNAKGSLIAFTDDDCIPDRHWLQAFVHRHDDNTPLAAYTGRVKVPLPAMPTDYERNTKGLEAAEFVTANCCCTKNALVLCEGFDENFGAAWREDSDLHFKLLSNNIPVTRLDLALVCHPVRKAGWGISVKEEKKGLYNALLYKKYPLLYRQYIQPQPIWLYYYMVLLFITAITGLAYNVEWLAGFASTIFIWLLAGFILKRTEGTSRKLPHLSEMVITSLAIPFLSLFWHFYGAVRYKVFYL